MAKLYKRGQTYWARAQRGNREFRTSLKTTDRRVAEGRYRDWFKQLEALSFGEKPRRLFPEVIKKFIGEHYPSLKPSSAVRYSVSLKWLGDQFGALFLDQIGTEQLSDFETQRRATGASAPTIRRDFACLSSVFASALDWEWTETNPVPAYLKRRSKRGLKEAPPRARYLSEAEEALLLPAASPAVREAITLAIDTGLRREEMFSLTWGQVDIARGVIQTTTKTKSGRLRSVPLPDRSRTILAQRKAAQRASVSSVHVFTHEDGSRIGQMEKGFKGAVRRAGLSGLRWHDLRRTAGCRWLQRDRRSMEEVCILLGHSSVKVTETTYAFLDSETVAADVAQKPHRGQRISQ